MDKNNSYNDHPEAGNLLGSIPKKEHVAAPEGYFEAFPGEIMNRIQSAPAFYAIEKQEYLAQPEGYASDLHQKVMSAIGRQAAVKTVKIVSLPVKIFRWTAVAASLAILFTVGYYAMSNYQDQPSETQIHIAENPGMTHEDCQHYLEDEMNIDDAIAYYVNVHNTETSVSEQSAELDYLMEEEIELENY
jgi:hypothetical protein